MKLFYPYFNLFVKEGTKNYRLDTLIKIQGKYKLDTIHQEWDGTAWNVKFYFEADLKLEEVAEVQLQEYAVNLKPDDPKQLDIIKIKVYKEPKAIIENTKPEEEGSGQTGNENGEVEP